MKVLLVFFSIIVLSCITKQDPNHITDISQIRKSSPNKIPLSKLAKLSITGDFDADTLNDTLYQHNFSELHQMEIDSAADPFQTEWDSVVKWFYTQESDVYLAFNKAGRDTLHLGEGQGLYCLLNLGDLNKDGTDEIALVVDHIDYSNLNSCKIYTLCSGRWTKVMQFSVSESAFEYTSSTYPLFTHINGYLEKRDNRWVYRDYMKYINAEHTKDTLMHTLKISKCQ